MAASVDGDRTERRTSRRKLLGSVVAGGAGLTALAITGCGDDDKGDATSPNGSPAATATQGATTTTEATKPAADTGKPGGNLVVTAFADAATMDPHASTATADDLGLRSTSLFEAFTQQDDQLTYTPSLAEKWDTSADGVEWTFHLRKGVTFHDGTPFNAEAAKANYDRVADAKNALGARTFLVYFKEAQVIDEYTLKLVHSQGDAAVLANAGSIPMVSPTAFGAKSKEDFGKAPVGTGPFKFKEWTRDDHFTVVRNDDYWGPKPKLDSITFQVIRDENARTAAVRTGTADFIPRVSYSLLPALQKDSSVTVIETIPSFRTYFGIGNRPKFQDKRVRQAIVRYGCPRQKILDTAFQGHGEIAVGPVPSVSEWYIDYTKQVYYDPAKAKSLLQEAGASNFSFEAIYPAGEPVLVDSLTIWQAALKEIGVTMTLTSMDNSAFLPKILDAAGDYDMCFAPSQGPMGDFQVIRATHLSTGSANISHNNNADLDTLIQKGQATLDPKARKEIYDQAFQLVIDDAKQYYVTFYPNYRVLSKRVKGYTKDHATFFKFENTTVL